VVYFSLLKHCTTDPPQAPNNLAALHSPGLVFVGGSFYCEFFFGSDPTFPGRALSTFIHMFLRKAGPFTLENHIHVKALKRQGFPNNLMPY